jgi:hypothetical protein
MNGSFIMRVGAKTIGEVRPDEGEIDIPGAKRTVVADFGAR